MCSGHAFGVHWIDLADQRRAGGMLLGCLGDLGGLLEVPWVPLGVSWEVLGCLGGPGSVLGSSWGALGVILDVWGDPWVSPGRSECCYFVGFRWYSEMSCFLMIFHRNLEVMMFPRKMENYMVFTLILWGRIVDISLVLGNILRCHVFLRFFIDI